MSAAIRLVVTAVQKSRSKQMFLLWGIIIAAMVLGVIFLNWRAETRHSLLHAKLDRIISLQLEQREKAKG